LQVPQIIAPSTEDFPHSSPDDSVLLLAGKAYGTSFSLWKKFFNILVDGPDLTKVANPSYLSDRDRELREDYQNLLSVDPRLLDVLTRKSNDEAARLLTLGRDGFRNSEVHAISKAIPLWPTGHNIPASKPLRGVNNDVCGALLCPPSYDWDDPSVRENIRNHTIVLDEDDLPRFLWERETANVRDLNVGFLRGEILVRTTLAVLLGPAVAQTGEGNGAGGYADKFNMRSVTIPAIALMAALARHALTADGKFAWAAGTGTRFSYLRFYHTIIKAVSGWSQTDKTQLTAWWDGRVLSRLRGTSRAVSQLDRPRPDSAAALMQQQQGRGA